MASILEAMMSAPEFRIEEERDAYLDKLYQKMAAKRTTHDSKVVAKLNECLERAKTPIKWKSLVRYPYIEGKPAHFHNGKTLPDSWEPGHELERNEDGSIIWHCIFAAPCPIFGHELYGHHSVELFPDGKLVGETYFSGTGKLDMQDLVQILEKWLASICPAEEEYWDTVDGKDMKKSE